MGGVATDSCFQPVSSSEPSYVDGSKQILDYDTAVDELDQLFHLIPDSIWSEIDEIIQTTNLLTADQQSRRQLVRKRKYREVCVDTQLDYTYGLEKRKRARMDESTEFLKPKTYQCGYCPSDMLNVQVYLRHLRRHREDELRHQKSRCNSCGSLFNDVIQTKWHQTRCLRRPIVGNL